MLPSNFPGRYVEVFERMVEPDRAIQFRVAWIDDKGKQQVNRGYRVQFNQVKTAPAYVS